MKKLLGLLLLLLTSAAFADQGGFLFVTTRGQNSAMDEQVYFGLSKDGMQWEVLNGGSPVLVSTVGEKGARDPYLLRGEDGKFYILATNLCIFANRNWKRAVEAGSRSIVLWDSSDLVHWSEPRLVEVAPPDAGCAWAPEAIYDSTQRKYLVYYASTTKEDSFKKQRVWGTWTTDFQTFSAPFIYWERAGHVGDPDIVLGDDGKYYRFFRDGAANSIAMEVSDSLTGQWQAVLGFSLADEKAAGSPLCVLLKAAENGEPPAWWLFVNISTKGDAYAPFITDKLSSGNFIPAPGVSFPFPFHQGSVLALTTEEYDRVKAAYQKAKE